MTPPPAHQGRSRAWLPVIAAVVLVVFHYGTRADAIGVYTPARGWTPLTAPPLPTGLHFGAAAILLGLVPVGFARWATGLRLRDLGLGLGRWRNGLTWLAVGLPLAVVAGYIGAGDAAIQATYPLEPALSREAAAFVPHALTQGLYFGAWEVLFRGVLLFGLREGSGASGANAIQTALSVTAHFGRPFQETLAAIPAGLVFGWIDLRVGSVWYVAVVHWIVGVSLDWFLLGS